eukprot:g18307.t1
MALACVHPHASRAWSRRFFRGFVFALAVAVLATVVNKSALNFGLTSRLAPASNARQVYVKAQPEKADAAPHEMEDNTRLLAMLCKGAECAME